MSQPWFLRRIYPSFANRYMRPRSDADRRVRDVGVATTREDPGLRAVAELWASFSSPEHDLRKGAPGIAAPTLVAWGRRDPVIPLKLGRRAAASIPGAELAIFESGHSPQVSDPEGFAEKLVPFADAAFARARPRRAPDERRASSLALGAARRGPAGRDGRRRDRVLRARQGPALLFSHGWLANANLWRGVVERLHGEFRCLALDLPLGSHRTPMDPDADLGPEGVAALIADVAERLDLAGRTLVGNDSGGAYSQIALARHGDRLAERVSRLVLTSCETPYDEWPPEPFDGLPAAAADPEALGQLLSALEDPAVRALPVAYGLLTKHPLDARGLRRLRSPGRPRRGRPPRRRQGDGLGDGPRPCARRARH